MTLLAKHLIYIKNLITKDYVMHLLPKQEVDLVNTQKVMFHSLHVVMIWFKTKILDEVVDFMLGRFRAWYQDEGIAVDVIQAVLARRPTRPADFDARVRAVSHFRTLDSAEALAATNKRVSNILAKAGAAIGEINLTACVEPAEKALAEAVLALRTEVQPLIAQGDYTAVLDKLANLRAPVDSFFDNVMVNAEDPALRQNRLAILNTLQGLFLQVADISVLQ